MPHQTRKKTDFQTAIMRLVGIIFACSVAWSITSKCTDKLATDKDAARHATEKSDDEQRQKEATDAQDKIEDKKMRAALAQQRAAQLAKEAADLQERGRKESDALSVWHGKFPEGERFLLDVAYIHDADDTTGILMDLVGDNHLILQRGPLNAGTNKSDYELRWSAGKIPLEEQVRFDSEERAFIKLIQKIPVSAQKEKGWHDVSLELNTQEFTGKYSRVAGADGAHFQDTYRHPYAGLDYRIVVSSVDDGSPAAKAGMEEGDVLLGINREDLKGQSLQDISRRFTLLPGSMLVYVLFRPKQPHVYALTKSEVQDSDGKELGLIIVRKDGEVGYINGVIPGSSAEKAGIHMGDVITSVNGIQLTAMDNGTLSEQFAGPVGSPVTMGIEHIFAVPVGFTLEEDCPTKSVNVTVPNINTPAPASFAWPSLTALTHATAPTVLKALNLNAAPVVPSQQTAGQQTGDSGKQIAASLVYKYLASRDSEIEATSSQFFDPRGTHFYGSVKLYKPEEIQKAIKGQNDKNLYRKFTILKNGLYIADRGDKTFDIHAHVRVDMGPDEASAKSDGNGNYYFRVKLYPAGAFITHLSGKVEHVSDFQEGDQYLGTVSR